MSKPTSTTPSNTITHIPPSPGPLPHSAATNQNVNSAESDGSGTDQGLYTSTKKGQFKKKIKNIGKTSVTKYRAGTPTWQEMLQSAKGKQAKKANKVVRFLPLT